MKTYKTKAKEWLYDFTGDEVSGEEFRGAYEFAKWLDQEARDKTLDGQVSPPAYVENFETKCGCVCHGSPTASIHGRVCPWCKPASSTEKPQQPEECEHSYEVLTAYENPPKSKEIG